MKFSDAIFRSKKKVYKRGIRRTNKKARFGKILQENKEL